MRSFSLFLATFIAAIICFIGAAIILLYSFGHFARIEPISAQNCTAVVGVPGVDDFASDPGAPNGGTNVVFLSSMDRRADQARGAIVRFDPADPLAQSSWRDRTKGIPVAFEPVGIDLFDAGGVKRLFVINKADKAVLIYDVSATGDLNLLSTVSDRRLVAPNDIVATGPSSFYVTNSFASDPDSLTAQIDYVLKRRTGSVFYFDGASWSIAADNLALANGITMSRDGRRLYVAETTAAQIAYFQRAPETGVLQFDKVMPVTTFPDSLEWAVQDKILLFAANPKPLTIPAYIKSADKPSPSEIGVIKTFADDMVGLDFSYRNDGAELSAATAAAQIGPKLLIGGFMEDKFLVCE